MKVKSKRFTYHRESPTSVPFQTAQKFDQLIREAIAQKHLIRIQYGDKDRIAEPHDYGEMTGVPRLFCFQVGGQSSNPLPNWRLLDVAKITELELLEKRFSGSRGASYNKHLVWDKVFARVAPPGKEPE